LSTVERRPLPRWTEIGRSLCNVAHEEQREFEHVMHELRRSIANGERKPDDFLLFENGPEERRDYTPPPDQGPVANPDSYSTNEHTTLTVAAPGVLGNDSDPDGDTLTATLVDGPANGSLSLNVDGSFSYTPNAGFTGSDSFTYKASDATTDSNTATVSITVKDATPTVAVAAGGSCGANDRSGTLNLVLADADSPAGSLALSATSNNTALVPNGSVTFAGSGANRTLTVTTASGRTGTAVLTVTVSDG
jgi:hypothetical protein